MARTDTTRTGADAKGTDAEAAGAAVSGPVAASWPALAPIQRALGATTGPGGVADAAFGGRLLTWQNPSFMGTASHSVLDGRSSALLAGSAPRTSARPTPGLERPSPALPLAGSEPAVQRAPAVPLRALPRGGAPASYGTASHGAASYGTAAPVAAPSV